MIVLELLWSGIEDDVSLCGVADSTAFGVLACGVDGVDDGVRKEGSHAMVWSSMSQTSTTPPFGWMRS